MRGSTVQTYMTDYVHKQLYNWLIHMPPTQNNITDHSLYSHQITEQITALTDQQKSREYFVL